MTTKLIEPLEARRYFVQWHVQRAYDDPVWESGSLTTTTVYIDADPSTPEVVDIFGTAGNDRILVTSSGVFVNRVNRGVLPWGSSQPLRISGGRGDDIISIETAYDEPILIFGGGGNDVIYGSARAERIMAGEGNDLVIGGDGRDTIYGEGGDDSIRGGGSSDLIIGGDGFDTLRGDGGNDNLDGGASKDRLRGSAGDDRLYGSGGNDIIAGEDGNDVLYGGAGQDLLDGGAGDDQLTGEGAVDSLYGGLGSDAFPDVDYPDFSDFGTGDQILPAAASAALAPGVQWLLDAHASAISAYGRDYSDEFLIQKMR